MQMNLIASIIGSALVCYLIDQFHINSQIACILIYGSILLVKFVPEKRGLKFNRQSFQQQAVKSLVAMTVFTFWMELVPILNHNQTTNIFLKLAAIILSFFLINCVAKLLNLKFSVSLNASTGRNQES